jgi:hypothetical protein
MFFIFISPHRREFPALGQLAAINPARIRKKIAITNRPASPSNLLTGLILAANAAAEQAHLTESEPPPDASWTQQPFFDGKARFMQGCGGDTSANRLARPG